MYYIYRGSYCLGSCRYFEQISPLLTQLLEREVSTPTRLQFLYYVKVFSNPGTTTLLTSPNNNPTMRDITDIFIRKVDVPARYLGATVSNQSLRTANMDVFILRRTHARITESEDLSFLEENESVLCQVVRSGMAINYRINNLDNFRMIESGAVSREGFIIENPTLENTNLTLENAEEMVEYLLSAESATEVPTRVLEW